MPRVMSSRDGSHAGHPENERCDQLAVQAYQDLLKRSGEGSDRPDR